MPFSDLYMETGAVNYEPGPLHLTCFSGMTYRNPAWKCRGAGLSWQTAHCFAEDVLPLSAFTPLVYLDCIPGEDSPLLISSGANADQSLWVFLKHTQIKHFERNNRTFGNGNYLLFLFELPAMKDAFQSTRSQQLMLCFFFPSHPDLGTALIHQHTIFLLLLNLTSWETEIWVLSLWKCDSQQEKKSLTGGLLFQNNSS